MYTIYLWKANGIPKYVGSTKQNLEKRIQQHYSNKKVVIYKYIREYPNEKFSYVAIDYANTKEEALLKESFWTNFYRGKFSMINKFTGAIPDDNTRRKISEANKGIKRSEELKKHLSDMKAGKNHPFYGKHHTEETKRKLSEANKGKHHTEEFKEHLSNMFTGKNNPFYGKHHTEESKKKVSEAKKEWYKTHTSPNLGKHLSEETKRKLSEVRKGKLCGKANPKATKVRIKETNQIFDTINEAAEYLNVNGVTIRRSAQNNTKMKCGFTAEFYKDDK